MSVWSTWRGRGSRPSFLAPQARELAEVLGVGADRMRRGVALAFQVTEEGRRPPSSFRYFLCFAGTRYAAVPRLRAAEQRDRVQGAPRLRPRGASALSRISCGSSGRSPKAMLVGW